MTKIDTAIIPVAGLGTRMLPATKEQPKEMLPVPVRDPKYGLVFKPFLQLVYEQLYNIGVRNFVFVVGRGKRSIENYFTPDWGFARYLENRGKKREAEILYDFYNKLENSIIIWVNQPGPRGFGDAVYRGSLLLRDEPFLVHAGDIIILNNKNTQYSSFRRILQIYSERKPDALIVVKKVKDPRHYGVIIGERIQETGTLFNVRAVIEKPKKPISNIAITAIYIFTPVIKKALEELEHRVNEDEIELTDAIQLLIEWGFRVEALELDANDILIDIGRPETYIEAINTFLFLGKNMI